jgi:hypothetical protein
VCSVEPGRGATAQPGGEQAARPDAQTHRRDCEAALLQQDRGRGQAPGGQDQTSAPEQVCCFYYIKNDISLEALKGLSHEIDFKC